MEKLRQRPVLAYLIAQILLFVGLQIAKPEERLYFNWVDLSYILLFFFFFWIQGPRQWWQKGLAVLISSQAAFVVLFYVIHEGTLNLTSFFLVLVPGAVWGLVSLLVWSYKHLRQVESRQALLTCAISWGFFALAYPPLPLGPAGLVLLAPWLMVLWKAPMGRALFATFWSGVLFHAISYFWIFNVAKVGPAPAVIGGLFLLISYFSFFYVVGAWIFVRLRDFSRGRYLVWLFPLIWAGIEVVRSYGQISFPWGHLGYVFGNHVELVQGVRYVGVYGFSILLLFSNMVLAYGLQKRYFRLMIVPVFFLIAMWLLGSFEIKRADLESARNPSRPSMNIALVQPSISQTKKWSRAYYDSVMTKTWGLLRTIQQDSLDLIVLPETAIPDFMPMRKREAYKFHRFSDELKTPVLVGALNLDRQGPPPRNIHFFNAAFLFTPNYPDMIEYRKTRLVPFSEYLPFNGLLPVLNYVDLGEGDFSPGDSLPLMGNLHWTPNICYESIYPDLVRKMVRNGTNLLVNITNDGWFGKTTAPGQHANLIRYRAIEAGLPVARCANSGISIFYDAQGRSYEKTALFETRVVTHRLQIRSGITPYTWIGDAFENFLSILFALTLFALLVIRIRLWIKS